MAIIMLKASTDRPAQATIELLDNFRSETIEEIQESMHQSSPVSSIHSVFNESINLKSVLNHQVSVNLVKSKEVERLMREVQVLKKKEKTFELPLDFNSKMKEANLKILQAKSDKEQIVSMKNKIKKQVEIWKERLNVLSSLYEKTCKIHSKAMISKGIAMNGLIKIHTDTLSFKKHSEFNSKNNHESLNLCKSVFNMQRSDIDKLIENVSSYKLRIFDCKLLQEKALEELEYKLMAKDQLDKTMQTHKKLIKSLKKTQNTLNKILETKNKPAISTFSDSEIANLLDLHFSYKFDELSLGGMFQQLTYDYINKQKEFEALSDTLATLKENLVVTERKEYTVYMLKKSLEQINVGKHFEQAKASENNVLKFYLLFLNIAQQNNQYILKIEHYAKLERSLLLAQQVGKIQEMGRGFYKKENLQIRSESPYSGLDKEDFELQYQGKLRIEYFSLQQRGISTVHFQVVGDNQASKDFGKFIKGIPIISHFLNLSNIRDYLLESTDPYKDIHKLIDQAYYNFQSQISGLVNCMFGILNTIRLHSNNNVDQRNLVRSQNKFPTIVKNEWKARGQKMARVHEKYKPIDHNLKTDKTDNIEQARELILRRHTKLFGQDIKAEPKPKSNKKKIFSLLSPLRVQKELMLNQKKITELSNNENKIKASEALLGKFKSNSTYHSPSTSRDYMMKSNFLRK